MATRKPIVLVSGLLSELPVGDFTVELAASPSGLIYVGSKLGIDGSAQISGNAGISAAVTAQASGNAALVVGTSALASGNAALTSAALKLPLIGGTLTGDLTLNAQSDLRFADSDSSNYLALQAPATITSNVTMTLPAADGTNGQVLTTNGAGTLSFTTAASGASQWTTTGSDIYYTTGKVGIGSTGPSDKLSVAGSSATDFRALTLRNSDGTVGSAAVLTFEASSGTEGDPGTIAAQIKGVRDGSGTNGGLEFWTSGAGTPLQRARIDSSGRLLIGTSASLGVATSSVGQLQIADTTVGIGSITTFANNTNGGFLMFGKSRGATVGSYTVVQHNDQLGTIRFGGSDGTDLESFGASIEAYVDGTPGANDMPGRLVFSTTADGASTPTERVRLDSSGRLLVGTSTATGANLLQVNSDARINGVTVGRGSAASNNSNTAVGADALQASTTNTDYNTAVGYRALYVNTNGAGNIAVGYQALLANTTGNNNAALGRNTLTANISGINNVAIGINSLSLNTTGSKNTAVGVNSLEATTGDNNTAIGQQALDGNTTGTNNTGIGYLAAGASASTSNAVTLGNSSIATLRCAVTTITAISDARDKTNIINLPAGLDFINALRPVAFDWNTRDGAKVGIHEFGFIAQELQEVQVSTGITVPNLVSTENPDKLEASPGVLLPILINAVKQLSAQNAALEARLAALETA